MSDTGLASILQGPAVVVDDEIGDAASAIALIAAEIQAQDIPVLRLKGLPEEGDVRHWEGFSLIVLDWELPVDADVPAGVAMPESAPVMYDVAGFVGRLWKELYCPVFIYSHQDVDDIWRELEERLGVARRDLQVRLHVRSKRDVAGGVMADVASWLGRHPAVYALKAWEFEYSAARRTAFRDLEESSVSWPAIMWTAFSDDGTNPSAELAELISRNVLHRLRKVLFEESVFRAVDGVPSRTSLQRVLHRQAVVGPTSLHDDVISPGDFFYVEEYGEVPREVLINLSPACDLVPRKGQTIDEVELLIVAAVPLAETDFSNAERAERLLKDNAASSAVLHFLLEQGLPYRVKYRTWRVEKWAALKGLRRGRLLEPYVTRLQQENALHLHRQGLPKVPLRFYIE